MSRLVDLMLGDKVYVFFCVNLDFCLVKNRKLVVLIGVGIGIGLLVGFICDNVGKCFMYLFFGVCYLFSDVFYVLEIDCWFGEGKLILIEIVFFCIVVCSYV